MDTIVSGTSSQSGPLFYPDRCVCTCMRHLNCLSPGVCLYSLSDSMSAFFLAAENHETFVLSKFKWGGGVT